MFDKVTMYLVFKHNKIEPEGFETIIEKKSQIYEYILKTFIKDHQKHFESWCSLNNKNKDDLDVQRLYFSIANESSNNELEDKYAYNVFKVKIKKSLIISLFRKYTECVPKGCSYESPIESEVFTSVDLSKLN